jgi:hypothetical protein
MAAAAAQESWSASVAESGDLTARVGYAVALTDGRVIRKSFYESNRGGVIGGPLTRMLFDMFMLVENPFREADIKSVEMNVEVTGGVHVDQLVAARLDHATYRPGDRVSVIGRFRPWHGAEYEKTYSLDLPADLEPGGYVAHLTDSAGAMRIERSNHPCAFAPRDFDGVVGLIQKNDISDDELRLYLFEPATDVAINGFALDRLPFSMSALIQTTASPQVQNQAIGRELACQVNHHEGTIVGNQSLVVQVANQISE